MRLSYRVFWTPKHGSSKEEYEDAFAPEHFEEAETTSFRCSVADGATETSFSGLWAQILTAGYIAGETSYPRLQNQWLDKVSGKQLPWYAEQKLESGAFAAVVGLSLAEKNGKIKWKARALGDCCLFLVRANAIETSFPLESWHDFNNAPLLLSSRPGANDTVLEKVLQEKGECLPGDIFYLMSDAISAWFLRRQQEMGDAISLIEGVDRQESLEHLVDSERTRKDSEGRHWMTNDDVTLLRVAITAG